MTITPVNEAVTLTAEKDKIRKNEFVEQYNAQIKVVAQEMNVEVVDIYNVFIKKGSNELLCEDGLHPNTKGHEIIFEQVKDHLVDRF